MRERVQYKQSSNAESMDMSSGICTNKVLPPLEGLAFIVSACAKQAPHQDLMHEIFR